jgi:hypothetical protein
VEAEEDAHRRADPSGLHLGAGTLEGCARPAPARLAAHPRPREHCFLLPRKIRNEWKVEENVRVSVDNDEASP